MFPLSGRLEAASKSNSSTLEPSRMTTRVSSGWLASMSMRLVMRVSGARAIGAGGTTCGGQERTARIVDGKQARKPIRRNGQLTQKVWGRDSVGGERKSDSHCYFVAPFRDLGPKELPDGPLGSRSSRGIPGRTRAARQPRESQDAAGRTFCRVPAGFQQAINRQICDTGADSSVIIKLDQV